jgi:hypothetical protein
MQCMTLDIEAGQVSTELAHRGIPARTRVHVLVEVPDDGFGPGWGRLRLSRRGAGPFTPMPTPSNGLGRCSHSTPSRLRAFPSPTCPVTVPQFMTISVFATYGASGPFGAARQAGRAGTSLKNERLLKAGVD